MSQAGWRRARYAVLGWLVACALAIALQEAADPEPPPDRSLTTAVVVLAFGTIAGRMLAGSPVAGAGTRAAAAAVHLGCAAAIGGLALQLAIDHGAVRTALGFTAGGFILALRPLPGLSRDEGAGVA